jgi:DNA-binding SARP family transcriptional activator
MGGHREGIARVRLLGGFALTIASEPVELPPASQALIAYLAVSDRTSTRARVAAAFWPDLAPAVGLARERNALYRCNTASAGLVGARNGQIVLLPNVFVDLDAAREQAQRILADDIADQVAVDQFARDVLPDWDHEWLVTARQDFTMLRLRVLERLAGERLGAASFYDAERACRLVIEAEPYRESVWLLLTYVHLAEGNPGQALCVLKDYQRLLQDDLDLGVGERVERLRRSIRGGWIATQSRTGHLAPAAAGA